MQRRSPPSGKYYRIHTPGYGVAVDWFKSTVRVTGSKFDDPRKAESQD